MADFPQTDTTDAVRLVIKEALERGVRLCPPVLAGPRRLEASPRQHFRALFLAALLADENGRESA